MTEAGASAVPRLVALRTSIAAQPGWLVVLELYALSRVLSTSLLAAVFAVATGNGWDFASNRTQPDFFTFSGSWDASSYREIGEAGYPSELPRDGDGNVLPNVWAFLPLYPRVVHAVSIVTGLGFYTAGTIVSIVCGAGAAFFLYLLLRPARGREGSLWAVTLFVFGPLSFLLQTAYAESLFLLLSFACLTLAVRHRFGLAALAGVLAAFARPGALALSAAIGILAIVSLVRRDHALTRRQLVCALAAAAVIGVAGLSWPLIAGHATGEPGAYLESELSFWVDLVGRAHFVPGTPWFVLAFAYLGGAGIAIVLALIVATVLWLGRRRLAAIGPLARIYSVAYTAYLFAVFLPQQSVFRLLLPLAPLLGDPALDRGARFRRIVIAVLVPLQLVAIVLLWFLSFP